MAAWDKEPMKTLTIEKLTNLGKGSCDIGTRFDYTYKATTDWEARARARKAMLREHPDENPLDWMTV